MNNKKNRIGIFSYFLITYLAILIIPIISSALMYNFVVEKFEDNLKKHNMSVINTSVETVDTILNEIKNTSSVIKASKNVSDFMKIDSFSGPNKATINLLYLMKELNNIENVNNNIIDIFIYSGKSDAVITTTNLFMKSEFFYSNGFLNLEDVSYEKMKKSILLNPLQGLIIPYNNMKINNIPYNGYLYCKTDYNGSVIIVLNDAVFNQTLKELNIGDTGLVTVSDSSGKLYYQSGNTQNDFLSFSATQENDSSVEFVYDGTSYLSLSKQSQKTGLIYTAYIPKNLIMEQASIIKKITFIVFFCSILIAVALALFLSENSSKPIREILGLFSSRPHNYSYKTVIRHLKGNIDNIITSNSEFEIKLQEQIPIVRSAAISNLLSGNYNTEDELNHSLELAGINLKSDWYSVIILKISQSNKNTYESFIYNNKIKLLISDIVKALEEDYFVSVYDYSIDKTKTAFILSFNFQSNENGNNQVKRNTENIQNYLEDFAKSVCNSVFEKTGLKVVCAIGEAFVDYKNISSSFDQAKQVILSLPNYCEKSFYYFNDITRLDTDFYYPFEMEQRIGNAVKLGNSDRVEQLLRVVYLENFIKKSLGNTIKIHLLHTLYTTLIRSVGEIGFTVNSNIFLLNDNRSDISFDLVFDEIIKEFLSLAELYANKKTDDENCYKKLIIDYINSNFNDSSLTLAIVAEKFDISERALYVYFKNSLNDTFAAYLEKRRILKAKEFLLNEDWSVEKISEKVGYTNVRSFQRAFKRVVGYSPNDFRIKSKISDSSML